MEMRPVPADGVSDPLLQQTATAIALLPIIAAPVQYTPVTQPNSPLPTPTNLPGVVVIESPTATETPSPVPLPPIAQEVFLPESEKKKVIICNYLFSLLFALLHKPLIKNSSY